MHRNDSFEFLLLSLFCSLDQNKLFMYRKNLMDGVCVLKKCCFTSRWTVNNLSICQFAFHFNYGCAKLTDSAWVSSCQGNAIWLQRCSKWFWCIGCYSGSRSIARWLLRCYVWLLASPSQKYALICTTHKDILRAVAPPVHMLHSTLGYSLLTTKYLKAVPLNFERKKLKRNPTYTINTKAYNQELYFK